jgi:hypothetical protein
MGAFELRSQGWRIFLHGHTEAIAAIDPCLVPTLKLERLFAPLSVAGEDQEWIIWEWVPRAIAAGLRCVASRRPEGHYGRTSVNRIQAVISPKLRVKSFDSLADAREWLRHPW